MNRLSTPELTIPRKSAPATNPSTSIANASQENAVAPVRIGIGAIARHHPSFVQLYYAIEARRTSAMPLVVQFVSPTPGTGSSTVASGYARVAADDCAQPVLFIDCNGVAKPSRSRDKLPPAPTLFDTLRRGLPLADAIRPVRDTKNLVSARLGPGERPLLSLGGDRYNPSWTCYGPLIRLLCLIRRRPTLPSQPRYHATAMAPSWWSQPAAPANGKLKSPSHCWSVWAAKPLEWF